MPNSPREEIIKERLARYGVKPSRYAADMTKKQLAYKLAEMVSFVHCVKSMDEIFEFQKLYADWVDTTGDKITLKDVLVKVPKWVEKLTKSTKVIK